MRPRYGVKNVEQLASNPLVTNGCSGRYQLDGTRTIRTLVNSALVNSDPILFGPSQFGPCPLVNSDPDHWSIRTFL